MLNLLGKGILKTSQLTIFFSVGYIIGYFIDQMFYPIMKMAYKNYNYVGIFLIFLVQLYVCFLCVTMAHFLFSQSFINVSTLTTGTLTAQVVAFGFVKQELSDVWKDKLTPTQRQRLIMVSEREKIDFRTVASKSASSQNENFHQLIKYDY